MVEETSPAPGQSQGGAAATAAPSSTSAGGTAGAGGGGPSFCEQQSLPAQPFNGSGPFGAERHQLAADFTVTLLDGTSWQLSTQWSGCESYLFIPSSRSVSALDSSSIWSRDVDSLIAKSPQNVHYFFVAARKPADAASELSAMQARIAAALAKLDPAHAALWRDRLHVVGTHASQLGNWLGQLFSGIGAGGFAIDRDQRVRLLGSFADVSRFSNQLYNAMQWPWQENLAYAANEAVFYNYEAANEAAFAKDGAQVVTAWTTDEVVSHTVEKDVALPDAAAMAGFDTLTIDATLDCPDPAGDEFNNCDAWDRIADLFLLDEDGVTYREMARFITAYHREARYIVDATPMLALLQKGGTRHLRYVVGPDYDKQASFRSRVDLRFSNQGKGYRPVQASYLWSGGAFNSMYDAGFKPIDVDIPAAAKRVELWALITGHGGATDNCAEFCDHQHQFTVGAKAFLYDAGAPVVQHPNDGCMLTVAKGQVPNQAGTWWFGRGGWCPGEQVEPFVADVTAAVTPGQKATVSYSATLQGQSVPDNAGDIDMQSWLVVYE